MPVRVVYSSLYFQIKDVPCTPDRGVGKEAIFFYFLFPSLLTNNDNPLILYASPYFTAPLALFLPNFLDLKN